jgi:hypothetical protein
LELAL